MTALKESMARVLLCFITVALMDGGARAGVNAQGSAWLTWDQAGTLSNLNSTPAGARMLYLHLDNVSAMRSLAVELNWAPFDSLGQCYGPVAVEPEPACGVAAAIPPARTFEGDSSFAWTISFPSGADKPNCVSFSFSDSSCVGPTAASFSLGSVKALDPGGLVDELMVTGGATILGGVNGPPARVSLDARFELGRSVTGLPATAITASALTRQLRESGIPINFVLAARETPVVFPQGSSSLSTILTRLVAADTNYTFTLIDGRPVVVPRDTKYYEVDFLPPSSCSARPRYDAAVNLTLWLRANVAGFADLGPPPIKGNRAASAYTDSVALSQRSSVLRHLVEILGTDSTLCFAIVRAPSGHPRLTFYSARSRPTASAPPSVRAFRDVAPLHARTVYPCDATDLLISNESSGSCSNPDECGAEYDYQILGVAYNACDCSGCDITEVVEPDEGCEAGSVFTGPSCPVGAGGNVNGFCFDRVGLCDFPYNLPDGTCTEVYHQHVYVCGTLLEDVDYTFSISVSGLLCDGATVTRAVVQQYPPQACQTGVGPANLAAVGLAPPTPNPSSTSTEIVFSLPRGAVVRISLVDLAGRTVKVLAADSFTAGSHHIAWSGRDDAGALVPAGYYFLRLVTEGHVVVRPLVMRR